VGDKPPIRSKVATSKAASRDSINPTFNQELWLPVTFPAMTTKVRNRLVFLLIVACVQFFHLIPCLVCSSICRCAPLLCILLIAAFVRYPLLHSVSITIRSSTRYGTTTGAPTLTTWFRSSRRTSKSCKSTSSRA